MHAIREKAPDAICRINGLRVGSAVTAAQPLVWGSEQACCLRYFRHFLAAWLLSQAPLVLHEGPQLLAWSWVPSLGISLSFFARWPVAAVWLADYGDRHLRLGLCRWLFERSSGYGPFPFGSGRVHGLHAGARARRWPAYAIHFFGELTSITSYLLIGFNHQDIEARKSARQGLFVTVAGGLALMAGLVLLGVASGSWSLHDILRADEDLRQHALYTPHVDLFVAGCVYQIGAVPFPFLVAQRHGSANARVRLSALRHHGEGGHLLIGTAAARAGWHCPMDDNTLRGRSDHHADRRFFWRFITPTSRSCWRTRRSWRWVR